MSVEINGTIYAGEEQPPPGDMWGCRAGCEEGGVLPGAGCLPKHSSQLVWLRKLSRS